jgi:putative sterol carrier protein
MFIDEADPAAMDPLEFARVVKRTPTDELHRVLAGDRRAAILGELVRSMPDVFRADRAAGISAIVHWRVGGRADGGFDTYELTIDGGVCTASDDPVHEPRLVLTIGGVDFLRMVTGNAHPVALLMRGKLKSKGDLGLTAKFPNLFEPPRP